LRGWKFITPFTMITRIVVSTLVPDTSPFADADENIPSTWN